MKERVYKYNEKLLKHSRLYRYNVYLHKKTPSFSGLELFSRIVREENSFFNFFPQVV